MMVYFSFCFPIAMHANASAVGSKFKHQTRDSCCLCGGTVTENMTHTHSYTQKFEQKRTQHTIRVKAMKLMRMHRIMSTDIHLSIRDRSDLLLRKFYLCIIYIGIYQNIIVAPARRRIRDL